MLRLTFPLGRTALMGVLLAVLVAGLAEIVFRIPAVQDRLPPPSVGSNNLDFETKVHIFREEFEPQSPDCYFLGSSVVHRGLDPAAFEEAYFEQTGQTLHCFNFGVVSGHETTGLLLAEMLTRHTKTGSPPKLLIFGTVPRVISREGPSPVEDSPWLQYRLGNWSLTGWLAEHSAFFGYGTLYARELTLEQMDIADRFAQEQLLQGHAGYKPISRVIEIPPPASVRNILDYQTYRFNATGEERLEKMMAFAALPETQVVIVEIPEHGMVIDDYPGREADYRAVVAQMSAQIEAGGVLFWPTHDLDFWSDSQMWSDFAHLNRFGASALSTWLGEQVGRAVAQGDLVLPGD